MLKILYTGCFLLSLAISVQFTFEMRSAAQNREKCTKIPYSEGSRSFKVINVDIPKKLVASVCVSSMSVLICNQFYARELANSAY